MTIIKCPLCRGSGFADGCCEDCIAKYGQKICEFCGGKGTIVVENE